MAAKRLLRKVKTFRDVPAVLLALTYPPAQLRRVAILECGHEFDMGSSRSIPDRLACWHCRADPGAQPLLV